jgi:hypothetical protein
VLRTKDKADDSKEDGVIEDDVLDIVPIVVLPLLEVVEDVEEYGVKPTVVVAVVEDVLEADEDEISFETEGFLT